MKNIGMMRIFGLLSGIILIFAAACDSGGGSGDGTENVEVTTRLKNPVLENVTPIGYSSFALGVTNKFPFYDEQQTPENIGYKTLARSVRHIATNELYNFPEPSNPEQVRLYLKEFVEAGHIVTHEIHILSGPGMRKDRDYFINDFFGTKVGDERFVKEIVSNPGLQAYVQKRFAEVVAHARILESYGVHVLICPELEDNHPADTEFQNGRLSSYGILIKFLTDLGWSRQSIVRSGGKLHVIPDIRYERHPGKPIEAQKLFAGLRPGDIVNMDGVSFAYDTDPPNKCLYTESGVRALRDQALNSDVIFYVWHHELQGDATQIQAGCSFLAYPSQRDRIYPLKNPIRAISILLGIRPEEVIIE